MTYQTAAEALSDAVDAERWQERWESPEPWIERAQWAAVREALVELLALRVVALGEEDAEDIRCAMKWLADAERHLDEEDA